jgi:hypothetical protein
MMRDVPLLPAVQKKRIRRSYPVSLPIGGTGQGVRLGYSENSPGAGTNGPTLVTIEDKSAHKVVGGQKRRHAVTALQALDLRVTPE